MRRDLVAVVVVAVAVVVVVGAVGNRLLWIACRLGRRSCSVICKAIINHCKSQWNCCVKVMFGRSESNETLCFLAQSGSRRRFWEPRWVRPSRVCAQTRPLCKVEFRGADRIVMAASVVDCCGGRRSCSVICEVVMADRSGTAVYRWCLELLAWCRSCVRNTGHRKSSGRRVPPCAGGRGCTLKHTHNEQTRGLSRH